MPRLAALLDVMQLSEIIEVVTPDTFKRPIYPGNAIQTVQSTDAKRVITVHGLLPGSTRRRLCPYRDGLNRGRLSAFVENKLSGGERPELTSAKIIISGAGRWAPRRNSGR